MRTALVVTLAGELDMFGVRFHPGGALPLSRQSATRAHRSVGSAGMRCGGRWPAGWPMRSPARPAMTVSPSSNASCSIACATRTLMMRWLFVRLPYFAVFFGEALVCERSPQRSASVSDGSSACSTNAWDSPKGLARVTRFAHAVRSIERGPGSSDQGGTGGRLLRPGPFHSRISLARGANAHGLRRRANPCRKRSIPCGAGELIWGHRPTRQTRHPQTP